MSPKSYNKFVPTFLFSSAPQSGDNVIKITSNQTAVSVLRAVIIDCVYE